MSHSICLALTSCFNRKPTSTLKLSHSNQTHVIYAVHSTIFKPQNLFTFSEVPGLQSSHRKLTDTVASKCNMLIGRYCKGSTTKEH